MSNDPGAEATNAAERAQDMMLGVMFRAMTTAAGEAALWRARAMQAVAPGAASGPSGGDSQTDSAAGGE